MLSFFCIGAQKAGTTWLYNVLKQHQEVYLPPVKEINFFYEHHIGANNNFKNRFFANHWMNRRWRRILKTELLSNHLSIEEKEWYFKYLFTTPTLTNDGFQFYKSLFKNDLNKISGDITPNYSVLPLRTIEIIRKNLPNLKILLILRDPVERDWSALKMDLGARKNQDMESVSNKQITNYLANINPRSKYGKIINNWGKTYKQSFKIFFYDDLKKNPYSFFKEICSFLEIKHHEDSKTIGKKVLTGLKKEIPEEYAVKLSKMYFPMLEKLIDNKHIIDRTHIENWMNKYEKFI